MMIVAIIVCLIFMLLSMYSVADLFYYLGYNRACNSIFQEWKKEIDAASEIVSENDDSVWEKRMIRIDKCAELTDVLTDELDKIQLNKVLKEWYERRRSKRISKKPSLQTDIKHEEAH